MNDPAHRVLPLEVAKANLGRQLDAVVIEINAMGTFFSTRQLCLQSKWLTIMEIKDGT